MSEEKCEWSLGEPEWNGWNTCSGMFLLNEGTPSENEMRFCPFCGKEIIERSGG